MTRPEYSRILQLITFILVCGAGLATAFPVRAATPVISPVADHVPPHVALYVGWAGQPQNWPGYKSSRLRTVLAHSHFADFFSQDFPAMIAAHDHGNPAAVNNARRAEKMARIFFTHPSSVYIPAAVKSSADTVSLGIIVKAGPDRAEVIAALNQLFPKPVGRLALSVRRKIGYSGAWVFAFLNPTSAMMRAVAEKGELLAADPAFQAAMAQSIRRPVLSVYVNFHAAQRDEPALASFAKMDSHGSTMWKGLTDGGQLDPYTSYAMTAGFMEGQWRQDNFLAYKFPPTAQGHAITLLKLAPANALSAAVFHLNLPTLAEGLLTVAKNAHRKKRVNQALETINEMTGVDLRHDMINATGPQWLMYDVPSHGLPAYNGYVLVNRLRHPGRLMQSLAVLMPVAIMGGNAMVRQWGVTKPLSLNAVQIGDVTVNEVGLGITTLCYAIDNKNFFITLNLGAMRAALKQQSAGTSVLNNAAFQDVMTQLGDPRSPATISFTDSPKLLADGYKILTQGLQLPLAMADIQLPVSLRHIAPPLTDLTAAIEPSGSASWFDHAGWHERSISAFPMAGIFTAQSPSHYLGFFSSAWSAVNTHLPSPASTRPATTAPANPHLLR